jgi:hypothetical protein
VAWVCSSDRETRNACRSFVKKPLEKQCLGRLIIKMERREIRCEDETGPEEVHWLVFMFIEFRYQSFNMLCL